MNKNNLPTPRQQRRHREWLALVFVLVLAGMVVGMMLWYDRQETEKTERDRLEGQARVIGEHLEQQLQGVYNALQGIRGEMANMREPGFQERATSRLKVMADAMPGVRLMGIVDATGLVRASSQDEVPGADRSQREFFLTSRAHPDPDVFYVSAPYAGQPGVASIMVGRAVLHADRTFAGLIYAKLDPDFFNGVMRSVLYAPDMLAGLSTRTASCFCKRLQAPGRAARSRIFRFAVHPACAERAVQQLLSGPSGGSGQGSPDGAAHHQASPAGAGQTPVCAGES